MITTQPSPPLPAAPTDQGSDLGVGPYAYSIINQQYRHMVDQEGGVREDRDPEYLHQMRVGSRRLRTALQVFDQMVQLPKAARIPPIRKISQTLGQLRDLDVQIADIEQDYGQRIAHKGQMKALQKALGMLRKQRRQVFAEVEGMLTQPLYTQLKRAYEDWLRSPQFRPMAQLPLTLVLPDLLNPLIAKLLLHPGWLVTGEVVSPAHRQTLHDLRKVCKSVRYQAEFFSNFYGPDFRAWVKELKTWQDNLGKVQDTYVLMGLLAEQSHATTNLSQLHAVMAEKRQGALTDWERTRLRYLSPGFRQALYQQVLRPRLDQKPPAPGEPNLDLPGSPCGGLGR
ncbi:MAG: CHAD domain-containing protein [Cyanobacteriota bacterium]|nr:CHAD domain-containing protein [Cyanobacteriota bacterium]